jgi:hypothetical protein
MKQNAITNTNKGSLTNLKRGMATIEFYQKLKLIRNAYNDGFVVYKHLYKHIKKKYGLKMSYRSFINYAKKEFEPNSNEKEVGKKSGQVKKVINNNEVIRGELIEPINDTPSSKKEEIDEDTQKSMEEYLKNMSHIFEAKKRRNKQ